MRYPSILRGKRELKRAMVNKNVKYFLLTLAVLWVSSMAVFTPSFVAAHRETKTALQTFDDYAAAMTHQQIAEAYDLCGPEFRSSLPYDQFLALQDSLQRSFGPLKSIKRFSYKIHASGEPAFWAARINADLVYEKKSLQFTFEFHKEGNHWILFGADQR